jgi:uncharacterized glyoxalase superfamily protein PhnB
MATYRPAEFAFMADMSDADIREAMDAAFDRLQRTGSTSSERFAYAYWAEAMRRGI